MALDRHPQTAASTPAITGASATESHAAREAPRLSTGGAIPSVLADPGDAGGGGRASSASELAYAGHDMKLAADFDGVGGGDMIKNAFWKARYDGTTELFAAAEDDIRARMRARTTNDITIQFWVSCVRDLLWDMKKLHDNAAGRRHADVDVAMFRGQLDRCPVLTRGEKSFILGGFDALVAKGAPGQGVDHDDEPAAAPATADTAAPPPTLAGDPVWIDYLSNTTDATMTLDRATTFGEVVGDSVPGMVDAIIAKAKGHPIGYLTITGHGGSGGQDVGEHGEIDLTMSAADRAQLARLRPYFAPHAEVVLGGCEVGSGPRGEKFVSMLAGLWGVRVRAAVPFQRLFPGLEGTETIAEPDGNGGTRTETRESALNEAWRAQPGFSDDDDVVQVLDRTSDKTFAVYSVQARYRAAVVLMSGHTNAHEGDLIVKLFRTASAADRHELYRYLEGHAWAGDFRHGWVTDDDGLYNSLTDAQLAELRALLLAL